MRAFWAGGRYGPPWRPERQPRTPPFGVIAESRCLLIRDRRIADRVVRPAEGNTGNGMPRGRCGDVSQPQGPETTRIVLATCIAFSAAIRRRSSGRPEPRAVRDMPRTGTSHELDAVDLFAGCGGLTQGLRLAGFRVRLAIDVDHLAATCYRANQEAVDLWERDIVKVTAKEILGHFRWKPGSLPLLAGCPPCQGFSALRTLNGGRTVDDSRNDLVEDFCRLALGLRPKAILLENVPGLADDVRFESMVTKLRAADYVVQWAVLDAANFNVPQRRRRLILTAGAGFSVPFPSARKRPMSVRRALKALPAAGDSGDPAHDHGERRSASVRQRIERTPLDGGSRTDLSDEQQLACHRRCGGFKDVYGRMSWDDVAPTITSGFVNPSKGRFLHPVEHRAITVREGAVLQTFPKGYRFPMSAGKFPVAELIGNAVPPAFACLQGRAIRKALADATHPHT